MTQGGDPRRNFHSTGQQPQLALCAQAGKDAKAIEVILLFVGSLFEPHHIQIHVKGAEGVLRFIILIGSF